MHAWGPFLVACKIDALTMQPPHAHLPEPHEFPPPQTPTAGAPSPEEASTTCGDPEASGSDRADLIFDLLLSSLEGGGVPCLAHLLLGFDTTAPPGDWHERLLLPRSEFSCLTVLLDVLQVRGWSLGARLRSCGLSALFFVACSVTLNRVQLQAA